MARYDRLALVPLSARADAFAGWLALRDLEGCERDAERARRARLHFLALRPLRRLLEWGFDGVPRDSLHRQLQAAREELGALPSRDPARLRLAQLLRVIDGGTPGAVTREAALLAVAAASWGYAHAAEEYALTALEIAQQHDLGVEQLDAMRALSKVLLAAGRREESESFSRDCATFALQLGDRPRWAEAMTDRSLAVAAAGDTGMAREILLHVAERGREWNDPQVRAVAAEALCAQVEAARHAAAELDTLALALGAVVP